MELRLQLETLLPVEAVHRREGKGFFSQHTFQSFTPAFQHGAAYLRGNVRRSPEDLRSQNLEATVVQDAILEDKHGANVTTVNSPFTAHFTQFTLQQYLQWPQCDIHVSINAICTEHGLLRPSGEGQQDFLVLCRQKMS